MLVAAGLGAAGEHALISLLALNGLRVSEATGANIEAMGLERGHQTLTITRKGGKVVTIPLAPRTARAIDLAVGERCEGPIFVAADGRRLDRHGAARIVRRVARRAGITKAVGPHTLRHTFITAAQFGRSRPVARCSGGGLARRSKDHDALRPGTGIAGPAGYLHCRGIHRRSRALASLADTGRCRALCSIAKHYQAVVGGEVTEVGSVERYQRDLVAQAACGDPGVVLRSGPSPELGGPGQLTPHPGDPSAGGDDRAPGRPRVQAAPPVPAPPTGHRPLGQLADSDEPQPDPGTGGGRG
jgi:hypothetical protein